MSLVKRARQRVDVLWDHAAPHRTQLRARLEACVQLYDSTLRPHPAFGAATFVYSQICWPALVWATPPLTLHWMYERVWLEYWWERGGKWAWPNAFPAHRVAFIVLCVVIPYWAAYMAGGMIVWAVVAALARRSSRRLRDPRHSGRYERVSNLELEPILSDDDDEGVGKTMQPLFTSALLNKLKRKRGRLHIRWWLLLFAYSAVALVGVHGWRHWEQPNDIRFRPHLERAVAHPRKEGYGKQEKVFLTALFHDNHDILPFWIEQMTRVVHYLGSDNVFVSIMESWSEDDSAELLEEFGRTLDSLHVPHRILVNDTTILRPENMETDLIRINFLSASRNRVLEPLEDPATYAAVGGRPFDRVIYSNDVYIHAESVVELLNSRDGDYDFVCGVDFGPWGLYDSWVTRDKMGGFASSLWPYFLEDTGFEAIEADEPGPALACWNGIVAMRAEPLLPPSFRPPANDSTARLSTTTLSRPVPATHPVFGSPGENTPPKERPALRFRASGPRECFSSECFLFPYDLQRLYGLDKVYMNPRVINAYVWDHYLLYKYVTRHPIVKWFIENVEDGYGIHKAKMIVGPKDQVYFWDGGACQASGQEKRDTTGTHFYDRRGVGTYDDGRRLLPRAGAEL